MNSPNFLRASSRSDLDAGLPRLVMGSRLVRGDRSSILDGLQANRRLCDPQWSSALAHEFGRAYWARRRPVPPTTSQLYSPLLLGSLPSHGKLEFKCQHSWTLKRSWTRGDSNPRPPHCDQSTNLAINTSPEPKTNLYRRLTCSKLRRPLDHCSSFRWARTKWGVRFTGLENHTDKCVIRPSKAGRRILTSQNAVSGTSARITD